MESYWQCDKKDWGQRLEHIHSNATFADVVFKVGSEEIKAHKLILAFTSPVFEKMFFGELATKARVSKAIEIVDIEAHIFRALINYAYNKSCNALDVADTTKLHKAADMYLMDDLKLYCLNYICDKVQPNDAMKVLDYANMVGNHSMKDQAIQLINQKSAEVLASPALRHVSLDTIKILLFECQLKARAFMIFNALFDWSKTHLKDCDAEDDKLGNNSMRSLWMKNGFMRKVRFTDMSPKEFVTCSTLSKLFNHEECFQILGFISGGSNKLPICLGSTIEAFKPNIAIGQVEIIVGKSCAFVPEFSCKVLLESSADVKMFGFRSTIEGKVNVYSCTDGGRTDIYQWESEDDMVSDQFYADIILDELFYLEAGKKYRLEFHYQSLPEYTSHNGNKSVSTVYTFDDTRHFTTQFGYADIKVDVDGKAPNNLMLFFVM